MEARMRFLGMDLAAVPDPARVVWSTLAAQLFRRATGQFFAPRVGEPKPLKPVDTAP